ncbi:hypothetical protein GBZ26_11285 [Azospirillum formosense]|uniref:Bacteriophage tail tape measure N-terminal domain-containing protein n=1 Tax=Azospirillum formosense TaxID=861533 RepID=A0ABX2KT22_9PROT|nr:phage tail length tape measure family protein [Azospirillum formosense]MBY3756714.1 hypothetical protein [Azospirillum formosense]NUB19794.1 hypothetical protein [Azospirillum formosense]
MAEKKVSVRLAVEADRLDETKRKLEELGIAIKSVGNDNGPDKLRRQFEALEGRLDPVSRATQRLAREQDLLNRALASGATSQQRYTELMNVSQQAHDRMIAGQSAATASTGQFKGALGNLGLQLQDVTVQAQMGTSAFIILAQQGPQIASAFGPAGIAIGTVVAIASVAAGVLFTLSDETKKSAKEIDTFGDVLGIFEGRARESGAAIETLTESYRALGGELRALSKLALQADIATLTEKRAKDQKSAWDAISNATMSGVQDVPAALGALQQLGQDKDLAAFMGKLQALNEKGAIKLMRDEDVRALLETGEALRVAEARMADLEGRATPAQKALLGYADAAREAARATREAAEAAYEMSRTQGLALGSVIVQERDLDRKIAALKGGEAAMKAYGEEQIRATTYDKAFKANLAAGESLLDARTEATRIATKAVEAYRLEQQRADEQKAANAASRKAESQAERDAKAYAKVSEELDRGIAEQQRLAGAVGQSVEAQREANTQTKIAEALAKAHATASTAEGKAIAGKVREQEKWRAAAADAAVLDSSKRQLAYAQQELSLMGQAEPLRERALKSFQIQQQAGELAKTTTAENVAEWVRLQEQIADTQAIKAFQLEIQGTAKEMSRDITEALLDRESKWSDLGKTIGKRIALGLIEANFVLPITTAVVGAVPGLFGIASPANQNVANPGGVAGAASTLGTAGNALSAGQSLYNVATGTNTLGTMASSFATSGMGYSMGLSSNAVAEGTGIAAGYVDTIGATQISNGMTLTQSGQAVTSGLGAIGQAMPYGALGGLAGSYIGSKTNSHLVGGLSGAALGVGSMAAGTAAMGAMGVGTAAAGMSGMAGASAALAAIPVYGWIAAAVLAAVTAIAGTQKKEYFGAATWSKFDPGAGTELGTDTASKHMDAGPVVDRKYAINSGMRTAMQASGLGFAGDGMWLGVDYDQDKQRWRTNLAGWDTGITVSRSQDPATAIVDTLKWLANNATEDSDRRPADKLGDIPLLVGDKNVITALRNTKNTTIEEVGKDMEAARVWTDVQKTTAAGYNYFNDAVQQMLHSAQQAAKRMEESYVDLLNRVSDTGLEERGRAQEMLRQSMEASLGIDDTTTALRNLLTPTEQVRIQFTALQPTLEALGYTAEQQAGIFDKLAAKAKKSVADTYDAQLRDVRGQGYLDELWSVRQWWDANALPVLDSGRNPNDLYEAKAKSIIDGLSDSQIDLVVSYFKELDPVMAGLADRLRGTTKATRDAADAQAAALRQNAESLRSYLDSLGLSDLSNLSPQQQYAEAQRQYAAALAGDDVSAATKANDALLRAARVMFGTTSEYGAVFDWSKSSLTEFGKRNGLPMFAAGGITDGPSIAGEGIYREAVVPLPDGRTIPARITDSGSRDVTAKLEEVRRELVASRQANTRMQQVTVGALALIQQAIEASTDAQARAALQAKLAALLADQTSEAA